jgi:hypothetical protein
MWEGSPVGVVFSHLRKQEFFGSMKDFEKIWGAYLETKRKDMN